MTKRTLIRMGITAVLAIGQATTAEGRQVADTTQLEQITVTATRVPVARDAVASTLTVLTGTELRAMGVTRVADALRSVPGVTVAPSGSFGSVTSVFMRGAESDYVQVRIDGVVVNAPGGAYDFAHLSTANIDRIEVVRGPASVLYGSEAAAGVIEIFTRNGTGPARVSAGVRGGTFESLALDADLAGATDHVSYSLGVSRFVTNGSYDFNNDYDNTVLSGRVQLAPDARTDVALSLRVRDSEFHFPTDGAGSLVDQNAFTLDRMTTIGLEAGRFITDHLEARITLASNVTDAAANDAQDDAADTLGFYAFRSEQDLTRRSVDARINLHATNGLVVTAGTQFEQQNEQSFNESESQFGPSEGSSDEERSNRAAYLQLLHHARRLSLVAGVRLDDNENFGTFATYRTAASYRFPSGTKIRGSVGTSFKAPTFFENFASGFVAGNPDLEPEHSTSWEIGLHQTIAGDRLAVSAVYFSQRFRDLIQFTFDQTPNYVNVAEADASGVEIEIGAGLIDGVRFSGNATFLDTEVIDAGVDRGDGATFVEGERLLRRPSVAFNFGLDYSGWDRASVGIRVSRVGDRDDRDFSGFPASPVELAPYTVVDASAHFDVFAPGAARPGVTATLRVENLFDEAYQTVFGFPNRGRTLFVGVRVGT